MKFYGRPQKETVTAPAGKLELLLALFKEKLIEQPEKALRVEAPLFRAFHSFANHEIEAAVTEAKKNGSDMVLLEASPYPTAEAELEENPPAPVPEPAVEATPEPEPASTTAEAPAGDVPTN